MAKSPYDILGISESATDEEVRKAYLKLARKYHPDLNPGKEDWAKKNFQEVKSAYDEILEMRKNPNQGGVSYSNYNNGNSANREDIIENFGNELKQRYINYDWQRVVRNSSSYDSIFVEYLKRIISIIDTYCEDISNGNAKMDGIILDGRMNNIYSDFESFIKSFCSCYSLPYILDNYNGEYIILGVNVWQGQNLFGIYQKAEKIKDVAPTIMEILEKTMGSDIPVRDFFNNCHARGRFSDTPVTLYYYHEYYNNPAPYGESIFKKYIEIYFNYFLGIFADFINNSSNDMGNLTANLSSKFSLSKRSLVSEYCQSYNIPFHIGEDLQNMTIGEQTSDLSNSSFSEVFSILSAQKNVSPLVQAKRFILRQLKKRKNPNQNN